VDRHFGWAARTSRLRKVPTRRQFFDNAASRADHDVLRGAHGVDRRPPTQHREIRADAPTGIRILTLALPPAAPATIDAHRRGSPAGRWTHVYGLTETAPLILVCEPRAEHASLDAQGRARIKARQGVELITSGELHVVDEQGNDVPRDGETVGEIVVRGNVVMEGYYRDPEATARAFHGGWFHSGDAAVVHPDGYVEIRDRLKDVIISGGENISSIEVEGALLRHPAVLEVAVVGLPHEKWARRRMRSSSSSPV
jgi:fatty-acyl-CoA synthase